MEDGILKVMNMKPTGKCQRIRGRPRWG